MGKKKKGETSVFTYPDWCKGCGVCAAFCPAKVIEIKDGKACAVREQECINCGFCELHCPDFAIVVRPKNETSLHLAPRQGTVEEPPSSQPDAESDVEQRS